MSMALGTKGSKYLYVFTDGFRDGENSESSSDM